MSDGRYLYDFTKGIRKETPNKFRYLLRHDRFDTDSICKLLLYACEVGDVEFLKDLQLMGADIAATSPEGKTALFTACEFGQVEAVRMILKWITDLERKKQLKKVRECKEVKVHLRQTDTTRQADCWSGGEDARGCCGLCSGCMSGCFGRCPCTCCKQEPEKQLLCWNTHVLYAKDNQGRNCLYVAIANKHRSVVDILLGLDTEKLKPLLEHSCTVKDEETGIIYHDSPLRMMLRKMPNVASRVLDKYIDRSKEQESIWECHYNLLDDTHIHECSTDTCHCLTYNRAKILAKRNHPLMLAYKNRSILNHHLVSSLLYHKWERVRPLHFLMLAWYTLFMGLVTSYMLSAKAFQNAYSGTALNFTRPVTQKDLDRQMILAYSLSSMSVLGVLSEIVQIILMRRLYFDGNSQIFQNTLDWLMYIFAFWVVMFPVQGYRTDLQWEIGSACMITSWFNFLLHHPGFSNYLQMVVQVFAELWRFTLVFILFLVMFGLTFAVLLNNQASYRTIFGSVIRTWTMMLGDIGYADIFHSEEEYEVIRYPHVSYILFIIFLLLGLIITNMWTGFIINRLSDVERGAVLKKLKMQLDYILTLEAFLPASLQSCCVFKEKSKTINLGVAHHRLMLVISMLLGDMKFSMPTLDDIKAVSASSKQKPEKSEHTEKMLENLRVMLERMQSEEGGEEDGEMTAEEEDEGVQSGPPDEPAHLQ